MTARQACADRLLLLLHRLARCSACALAVLALLGTAAHGAEGGNAATKRVLVISTGSRLAPGFIMIDQQLQQMLGQMQSPRIEMYAENLDIVRFPADRTRRVFNDYLSAKYAETPPDLVMLIFVGNLGVTATVLEDIFPGTPIIVAGFSEESFPPERFGPRVSGFVQRIDPGATLELIERLHPRLERLVVIGGTAEVDRESFDRAREAARRLAGRIRVDFWNDMSMQAIRQAVTALPANTAVLYTRLFRDGAGQAFIASEVGRWLGQAANAPVYVLSDPSFGTGAVGGALASAETFGRKAAELARRLLTDSALSQVPFEIRTDTVPTFDWRALQRWHIDERLLPEGSVLRFKQVSTWEQYRWYIVAAIMVILLQSAMIAALIFQRRDLRAVQASLEENQQLVALATEAGEIGLWSRDLASGEMWANAPLRSLLGLAMEGPLRFDEVIAGVHPLDRHRVMAELKRVETAGSPIEIEYRVQRPDGSERWVLAKGRKTLNGRASDTRRMGVVLDITERKRAEESLQKQQAFLRQVIDINPNLIFAKDREGRFTLANQAVADAYGVASPRELIGKTDADFNPNTHEVDFFRRMDAEVMDTLRERFIPEERLTDALGRERWLQTVKRPLIAADGSVNQILGASTDITQRKRTESELQEQRAELTHVSRVSMMGELAASVVHELNQPLTAILSNAQAGLRFMAHEPVDLQELREVLEDIVAANGRAAEIMNGMRALGRKDAEREFVAQDLPSTICEVARLAHGDAVAKGVQIELDLDENLPPVRGDKVQLQQVLLNILLNAFDAMKECRTQERVVKVQARRLDSRLNIVSVVDGGHGLRVDTVDKIFQPFYSTKRDGLGMGLSICRSIIRAHGGTLSAENNPEGGATFYFTVPVASTLPDKW